MGWIIAYVVVTVIVGLLVWSLCVAASRGDDWDQRP